MPRRRLTATNVETLPAIGGKRTTYVDSLLPSLELRVSSDGSRSYSVRTWSGRGRAGRRLIRTTLGRVGDITLADARDAARKALDRVSRGQAPRPPSLTVATLIEQCLDEIALKGSTRDRYERYARGELVPAFGDIPAGDLRRAEVKVWHKTLGRRSKVTANRSLELLRRVYSWAMREELVEHSPAQAIQALEEAGSWRVLTATELRALTRVLRRREELGHPSTDITWLLLLTGVRLGEIIGLRRSEVDGSLLVVGGERTKSGHDHLIPLSKPAEAVVRRRLKAAAGDHLFPAGGRGTGQDAPVRWHSAWKRDLNDDVDEELGHELAWTLHGLRHTLATQLRERLGVRRDVVSLILGHTLPGPQATRIYDRSELLDERRAALRAWAAWLARLEEASKDEVDQVAGGVLPFTR